MLAGFLQPHGILNEIVTTSAAHFADVPFFNGKEPARIWPIVVDSAEARTVGILLEEWTFEE